MKKNKIAKYSVSNGNFYGMASHFSTVKNNSELLEQKYAELKNAFDKNDFGEVEKILDEESIHLLKDTDSILYSHKVSVEKEKLEQKNIFQTYLYFLFNALALVLFSFRPDKTTAIGILFEYITSLLGAFLVVTVIYMVVYVTMELYYREDNHFIIAVNILLIGLTVGIFMLFTIF